MQNSSDHSGLVASIARQDDRDVRWMREIRQACAFTNLLVVMFGRESECVIDSIGVSDILRGSRRHDVQTTRPWEAGHLSGRRRFYDATSAAFGLIVCCERARDASSFGVGSSGRSAFHSTIPRTIAPLLRSWSR